MKQTLRLSTSQRLAMTPALQQAIRMLQLSTLDLKTEIRNKLESNVMLEIEEPEPVATDSAASEQQQIDSEDIPDNLPLDADWDDIYANGSAPAPVAPDSADWRSLKQDNLTATTDLHAYLDWQAALQPFTPLQRHIANHLIDAINDNGFITDWHEIHTYLTQNLRADDSTIETVLEAIQTFDPAGIGARSVAECLAIQLRQLDSTSSDHTLALRLVEDGHLDSLVHGRAPTLAHRLGVKTPELARARALLQTLQPHPGKTYAPSQADYIVPEVFVVRRQTGWQVLLNPDIAPRLRINKHYLGLMQDTANATDRATLQSHLQEARFFLHGLKSRNDTLLRVARCIVETQRGFLDYGPEAMQPMVLRDVSTQLNIHESTVSRATANKFMQTPRGIFELKYFFSSHVATTGGGNASATAIRAMIKRLISDEDPAKPLSDNKLSTLLRDETGIKVARRTIAKYREGMEIAPTHQRRRKNQ